MRQPIRVLFLCTANAARSQIAEALLVRKGGMRFEVASAGTDPAPAVRPEALAALGELGIDWLWHAPKGLDAVMNQTWDLVITLCDRARETCPTLPGTPVFAHWGVPDPMAATDAPRRQAAFQATVAVIAWRIDLMLTLRADALDLLVEEERLRQIGTLTPTSSTSTRQSLDAPSH